MEEQLRVKSKEKKARRAAAFKKIFLVIVRFLEVILIYLVPSFIITYITMYLPKENSWKVLCFFGSLFALFMHWVTARDYYQRLQGSLKQYFIVTNIAYFCMVAFSALMYVFIDENLLLYNFTLSVIRGFELFYEKTVFSMTLTHILVFMVYTITPIVLKIKDKKDAKYAKMVAESQDDMDKMGMIFDPDELPDLQPEEPISQVSTEQAGLLFDPDELPNPTEMFFSPPDMADIGYAGGLLFDPDEMPEGDDIKHHESVLDEEGDGGLLFDVDELPDFDQEPVMPVDVIDMGYAGGLLFDPDEMPDMPEEEKAAYKENEVGLLFNPDEPPEPVVGIIAPKDETDIDYAGGLLFDPDEPK